MLPAVVCLSPARLLVRTTKALTILQNPTDRVDAELLLFALFGTIRD
jgi:hypothetical protein